jgi:hypothetical protein
MNQKISGCRMHNADVNASCMYNGIPATMPEVLRYYNNPTGIFPHRVNIKPSFKQPLNPGREQQSDIIAFLETLTDQASLRK